MIAYHYTTGQKFELIKESGMLLPADIGMRPNEQPVLWFSSHPRYEPSALKPVADEYGNFIKLLNVKEMHELAGGLFRFGISTDKLKRGEELRKAAKITATVWRQLEKRGKKLKANPIDWFGYVGAMSLDDVSIEAMNEEMLWQPISG